MGETNSPSVAHVGYDISPLSRVKFGFFFRIHIQVTAMVLHTSAFT
jgi:hypothetical protein